MSGASIAVGGVVGVGTGARRLMRAMRMGEVSDARQPSQDNIFPEILALTGDTFIVSL